MSSRFVQDSTSSTKTFDDYDCMPPFFGKDNWTPDPAKIVTRRPKILFQRPEEKEVIKEPLKNELKRVRFASYVEVHMRCPIINEHVHYPSKMIEELKQENDLLKDDLLIAETRINRLETKLKTTQQKLSRARTINRNLPLWMVLLLFIYLVSLYKYNQTNL